MKFTGRCRPHRKQSDESEVMDRCAPFRAVEGAEFMKATALLTEAARLPVQLDCELTRMDLAASAATVEFFLLVKACIAAIDLQNSKRAP